MYKIAHIYEADFGCEERILGAPFMCLVEITKEEKTEGGIHVLSGMAVTGQLQEATEKTEEVTLLEIPDELAERLGLKEEGTISETLYRILLTTHKNREFFKGKKYFEFTADPVSDEILARMRGRSFGSDCFIPRENLRYLHVLHTDYDKKTHEGEMVCNKEIARELVEIFRYLYAAEYPIEKMRLIDDYDADDERSMGDNNSSAFCFRVVAGTAHLSRHAYGMAVDINPLYNPYVKPEKFTPVNAGAYVDRTADFPYKIARENEDYALTLFEAYGYFWGGEWGEVHDYQHFEK